MKVINKLNVPESWDEVSFGTYQLLSGLKLGEAKSKTEGLDNSIRVIATLLGTSRSNIESMKASDFLEVQGAVKFLGEDIPKTTKVKWKFIPVHKVSMDKWMAYERYIQSPEENLIKIMILMLEDEVTEAEIKAMAVTEVLSGFFTLMRNSDRSIRRSRKSLLKRMMKVHLKLIWTETLQRLRLKKRK